MTRRRAAHNAPCATVSSRIRGITRCEALRRSCRTTCSERQLRVGSVTGGYAACGSDGGPFTTAQRWLHLGHLKWSTPPLGELVWACHSP